jgi:chorismate-pyruvate lyase
MQKKSRRNIPIRIEPLCGRDGVMLEGFVIADSARKNSIIGTPLDKLIVENQSLSLFQKILLTTDGTVTHLLRLYTGETIKVNKIEQEIVLSDAPEAFLCAPGTPVLKRNILLRGTKNYLYAESVLVFERLSRSIQCKLLETDQPIGLLWKEEKLETNREIIECKTESGETLAHYFNIEPQTLMLSRTYLIYHQQNVLGSITEKFPVTFFKGENI